MGPPGRPRSGRIGPVPGLKQARFHVGYPFRNVFARFPPPLPHPTPVQSPQGLPPVHPFPQVLVGVARLPLGHGVKNVHTARVDDDLLPLWGGFQSLNDGRQFHAVAGGGPVIARNNPPLAVLEYDRRPTAPAPPCLADPLDEDFYLLRL